MLYICSRLNAFFALSDIFGKLKEMQETAFIFHLVPRIQCQVIMPNGNSRNLRISGKFQVEMEKVAIC